MTTRTVGSKQPTENKGAKPRKGLILGFLALTTFMVFLDADVVMTALPAIARDLEASNSVLLWVVNMYSLILAGFLLVAGSAGDRFGRRKALGIGLLIFGAGAAGASFAENSGTLIAMRGVQGLGAAFALPATLAIITDVFPREERAKAIATWTGIASLAIIVGPGTGGFIVDQIGWNAVFYLHLPLVALAFIGVLTVIPESRDSRRFSLDIPGAVFGTGGLLTLVYGIIQGGEAGWTSAEILGSFAASAAMFIAFAVVEARSAHPMLPLKYFKQKDFTGPFMVMMLIFMGMIAVFVYLSQFFQIVQDRSAFVAGLSLTPSALGMIVGAIIAGSATSKLGPKAVIVAATLIIVAATALFTQLEIDTPYWVSVIGIVTFGLGVGLAMPAVTDTLMASVPVNDAGIGSAMNDLSREFGLALGVAAVGSIVTGIYRTEVKDALEGLVPEGVAETIGESVGSVEAIAARLPSDVAAAVIEAADRTFVDAINIGYYGSIGFVVAALVVAIAIVPKRMRAAQAELEGEDGSQPEQGEAVGDLAG